MKKALKTLSNLFVKGKIMKSHILITIRYSLLTSNLRSSWKIGSNEKSFEDYKKELFDIKRMNFREYVFSNITLPSLNYIKKNIPEDCDFNVFIITSDELPSNNLSFLKNIESNHDYIKIFEQSSNNSDLNSPTVEYLNSKNVDDVYASVRLDDDDALSIEWLNEILTYMQAKFDDYVISLSSGLAVKLENNQINEVANYKWRFASAGLTYIGINNKKITTIYSLGNHTKIDEIKKTIIHSKGNYLIRTFSSFNDSKDQFPKNQTLHEYDADSKLKSFGLNLV